MGFNSQEPPATVDLYLKQGTDRTEIMTWPAAGVPVDFAGATARLPMMVDGIDALGLSSRITLYGGIVLGTAAGGTAGKIVIAITKAATQAIGAARARHAFYVDWPDGTSWCLFAGTTYLVPGSPN